MVKEKLNSNVYFSQLDGLRCIAVMSVLICHWITFKAVALIPLGSMGVNLFFVLSGFLISRILLIDKEGNGNCSILRPIKKFYIRRTLRIFPIYYLLVLILIAVNFPAARENSGWLLSYLFNIKFALPGVWESDKLTYMVHLWSLSVEEQFYLVFPFLIFLIPIKHIKAFLIITIGIGVFSRVGIYLMQWPKNAIYVLTPACLDSFGIGGLLAYFFMYDHDMLKKLLNKNYLFIAAVVLFIVSIIYSRNFIVGYKECRTITERFLFSICCFWIVGKGVMNDYSGYFLKFLESKTVIYIGKISYGLYIYHYFANPLFNTYLYDFFLFTKQFHCLTITKLIILFIMTFTVSSLSWYLIEKPINKIKTKFK